MNRLKEDKGFTLIESIVVIAIMAVLTAVAVPYFYTWRQSLKCKETAWGLLSEMRMARQMAMTNNLEYRVEMDVPSNRYRLTQGNLPADSTAWTVARPWKEITNESSLRSGSGCTVSTAVNVVFKPNGSAASAVICVRDYYNNTKYRVNLTQTTGRAYITN